MRPLFVFTLSILLPCCVAAQVYHAPVPQTPRPRQSISQRAQLDQEALPESNCSNQIDDDGNGLTDLEDFHCYFAPDNFYGDCKPSKIIWGSSMMYGFFYLNIETGAARFFQSPIYVGFSDLTWSSHGKLYASGDWGHIYEIDPYTFEATEIGDIEGHYYTNGMTGDNQGNLYVASFISQTESDILIFNPSTKKTTFVLSLKDHGLTSAGDLCFLNGYLYVACLGNRIARINLATKEVKVIKIRNPPLRDDIPDVGNYGMVTLGDGYLYVTDNRTKIFRVDPETGQCTEYFAYDSLDIFTTGLATYPDVCNAPGCRGEVNINIKSSTPFCSNTGVLLEAQGVGITSDPLYKWILPDQSEVNGQELQAMEAGEYKIRYYPASATCSITSSINVDIMKYPSVSLGIDTAICKNVPIDLQPVVTPGIAQYRWQDGSSQSKFQVTDAGKYYVTASNVCGAASDTINISFKPTPLVKLQQDTIICEYTKVDLFNLQPGIPVSYQWSTGATTDAISVFDPGIYWLDVHHSTCTNDKVRDTIVVKRKIDDCECFLHVPNAFTPNGDGRNDRFAMSSECNVTGTLQIFNRWGEVIFLGSDIMNGWNGMKNGTLQPTALYAYRLTYTYDGRPGTFTKNGYFHLIH